MNPHRIINKILKIFFLSSAFYFAACSGAGNNSTDDLSIAEIKSKVNNNSSKLNSLYSEGEISIDSPELSNSGSLTLNLRKPDSVYIKLEGPFGIDIADILLTRQNFLYYNAMDNRVIKGPSTPLNIGAILRIKLSFDEILDASSGTFSFRDISEDKCKLTVENGNYIITETLTGNCSKKYTIDSKFFYISKYGIYDDKGKVVLEIEYSDYTVKSGINFPTKIFVQKPEEKQYLYMYHNSFEINKEKINFKFKIPKSAKITEWD